MKVPSGMKKLLVEENRRFDRGNWEEISRLVCEYSVVLVFIYDYGGHGITTKVLLYYTNDGAKLLLDKNPVYAQLRRVNPRVY